ncbi:hypothetical protein OG225_03185 [Nocardia sp. NBC_01377]|uniref:hypothetical protein n=1 Tax=Nocardia sp. NBC_01377 TaxID=2903595 RepID=UPI00324D9637
MSGELKVELGIIESLGKAWANEVEPGLTNAANQIDALKFSQIRFGIFYNAWEAYRDTAQYLQDRLREGATRTDEIGAALYKVATTFEQQDIAGQTEFKKTEGEMDFSI